MDDLSYSPPGNDHSFYQPPVEIPKQHPLLSFKNILLFLSVAAIIATVSSGITFYFLNKDMQKVKQSQNTISPPPDSATISSTQNQIPDQKVNWKTYTITSVGVEFKLPPELSSLGELKEEIIPGDTGTVVCVSFFPENYNTIKPTDSIPQRGICERHILSTSFSAGTTSIDFAYGRGGSFSDLQGFSREKGIYYAKFVSGTRFQIPTRLIREMESIHGVRILQVKGENYESGEEEGLPLAGTPGNGRIGALINTYNAQYPGFAIDVHVDSVAPEVFGQILSTVKLTNQSVYQ